MTVLAIDQGTTSTRAILVHDDGRSEVRHAVAHGQHYPQAGWVEHDPAELLANLRACLAAAADVAGLEAIGIANQGESCLGWDAETGEPVGPVIVWQDDRSKGWLSGLDDAARTVIRDRAGLPADPYFSASKLGWIMREVPAARALAARGRLRLGTTDAWFRDRLTGKFATDPATASRTSLMNLATCAWDADLCALFGVPLDALPAIADSSGDLGLVTVGARQVPLGASIVDQQAALYGHGCRVPGQAKMTFGTGAFALALTDGLARPGAGGPVPTVAWRKRGEGAAYALEGGVYAAASAVNWARGLGLFDRFDAINAFDAAPAIDRGLAFVPALAGLACPHWDRGARGAWLGLSLDTTPRDMVQAVLEGVAFRMVEVVDAMEALQPLAGAHSVDGGMIANAYFLQFLVDQLGRDLIIADEPELTAMGVALLAAEAVGRDLPGVRAGRTISPRASRNSAKVRSAKVRFGSARQAVQGFGRASPPER